MSNLEIYFTRTSWFDEFRTSAVFDLERKETLEATRSSELWDKLAPIRSSMALLPPEIVLFQFLEKCCRSQVHHVLFFCDNSTLYFTSLLIDTARSLSVDSFKIQRIRRSGAQQIPQQEADFGISK
jgi:hypothetical protein